MATERTRRNNSMFSFVSGRHHGPEAWLYVQEELRRHGWKSIAHDLPIENPYFSLNDHARVVAHAERLQGDVDEIIRVGWSWGANVIPREIADLPVSQLIFVAGAFHKATLKIKSPRKEEDPVDALHYQQDSDNGVDFSAIYLPRYGPEPTKEATDNYNYSKWVPEDYEPPVHSLTYEIAEKNPETTLAALEETGDYLFYADVEDKMLVALIIGGLREHPRRKYEPYLPELPKIPAAYIKMLRDNALLPDAQDLIAKNLRIEPEEFDGCHAAMYSKEKAKQLAHKLIEIASRS